MGRSEGVNLLNSDRHIAAREMYEERAAIREFYAGYPKAEAERLAKIEVAAWLKAHPENERND